MEQLKKNKKVVIISAVILLLCMCCCLMSIMFGSVSDSTTDDQESTVQDNTDNQSTETSEQENLEPTESEIEKLIDANDFKKVDYSVISQKYGEPDYLFEAEAPVATNFGYETEDYDLQSNYLSNDARVFGGTIFFKNMTCQYDNFPEEKLEGALKSTGLESLISANWEHKVTRLTDRYEINDVNGWDRIYVDCSDENQFSVAFQADGWDQR